MTNGPYSIGSSTWNGLTKVVEEAGEVVQVGAKIMGNNGERIHFDGSDLNARMVEELGDLKAAIQFFIENNDFDPAEIEARADKKMALFNQWNSDQSS